MPERTKAILLIILSASFGSMVPAVSKISLEVMPPLAALYLRMLLSMILFIPIFSALHKPYSLQTFKGTWRMSLFLLANFGCMLFSLAYIPSALVPIVYATAPLLTIIIQKIIKAEQHISYIKWFGIVLGFAGVLITSLSVNSLGTLSTRTAIGVISILLGSASFSIYTILSKKHQHAIDPLHFPFTVTILVSIFIMPLFVINYLNHPFGHLLTAKHLTSLLTTAVIGTVLFYSVYQYAIKKSDATTASLFSYIQPIFAVSLSIVLLKESINVQFVVGAVITLLGAYIASLKTLSYGRHS